MCPANVWQASLRTLEVVVFTAYVELVYTSLLLLHVRFLPVGYLCCIVTCLGSSLGVTFSS